MKSIFKLAVSLLISGTAFGQNKKVINVQEFDNAIKKQDVIVLDVRRPDEFSEGHIRNAVNINWQNAELFKAEAGQLDKSKPVYVYCLAGVRSEKAANWLLKNGFKNVVALDGGIEAWKEEGMPVEKPNSDPK